MSKFIPDPQIQSLRPMRRGDIAFADGGTKTVGVQPVAFAQPLVTKAIAPPAPVLSLETLAGMPSETPVVGVAFAETLSQDAAVSVPLTTTNSLETLAGMPSESPTVGVAFTTTVV